MLDSIVPDAVAVTGTSLLLATSDVTGWK